MVTSLCELSSHYFRIIESVPNAVIVNESSVSFAITFGTRVLSMDLNVQYIIGRPANEQSFSSEHEV